MEQLNTPIFWKNIIFIVIFLTISSKECRANESSSCTLPSHWQGEWFQSGVSSRIFIQGSSLGSLGNCIETDGDKYLVVNENGCHRCVLMSEKHNNVLQYKESECDDNHNGNSKEHKTLEQLCATIPGDALLYSMFKINADTVKCPFEGSFTFKYNRGHGECSNPISKMKTGILGPVFYYQACPDVVGTESTIELLTCLATWKEGDTKYLVGTITNLERRNTHPHASYEDIYRCFVYEKIHHDGNSAEDIEYKLAQSGDATCSGLETAEDGYQTMTLRKVPVYE